MRVVHGVGSDQQFVTVFREHVTHHLQFMAL